MIHKRNHLSIFYDDLWAEHARLTSGKIVKPFKDRFKYGEANLDNDFKKDKPSIFKEIDKRLKLYTEPMFAEDIIRYADNRMMQGDYRYGRVHRQSLDNYNLIEEINNRLLRAIRNQNLEYVADAYNMFRLHSYKTSTRKNLLMRSIIVVINMALINDWRLEPIDDGEHCIEH